MNGNSAASVSTKRPGRVAVHDERQIGEAVPDGVERLRRRHHGLGQQVALHPALGRLSHVLAERHRDVGDQQVGRRHPGVDVERHLRARRHCRQYQNACEHADRERSGSHAFLRLVGAVARSEASPFGRSSTRQSDSTGAYLYHAGEAPATSADDASTGRAGAGEKRWNGPFDERTAAIDRMMRRLGSLHARK